MALLALALIPLAGCGGGGEKKPVQKLQTVAGAGYRFQAPPAWTVKRRSRGVQVAPAGDGATLVAVYVFKTVKPYSPALWARLVPELDRSAESLAKGLKGELSSSTTIRVAGDNARQYVISHGGTQSRYTFLFRGRTEYELICQWPEGDAEPAACATLTRTFRPS